jgi:ferrous iron transport protein B
VTGFYFLRHILDESRLFPRIAGLLNRPLHLLGLNGNAVIPLILGFGCVTVALVSTSILGTRRERLIAAGLLSIAVPCSAQGAIIFSFAFLLVRNIFCFTVCIFYFYPPGSAAEPSAARNPEARFFLRSASSFPDLKKIIRKTALEASVF